MASRELAAATSAVADAALTDAALQPLAPGAIHRICCGAVEVEIAAAAGGRIAQVRHDGVEWLVGHQPGHDTMIGWGSYPMLPWAGRIRQGRFVFEGRAHQLQRNLAPHAIHGLGFGLPWQIVARSDRSADLELDLPDDVHWPFAGIARQRIEVAAHSLAMTLSVTAGERSMPCVIGWHPWLIKPESIEFTPEYMYPNDAEGISTLPTIAPASPPWDHCFINRRPLLLRRAGQLLKIGSDCVHWVIFDEPPDSIAIEPQTGPPDAFNIEPTMLAPGQTLTAAFLWEWSRLPRRTSR